MKELQNSTRDIARELARKYSTMTHEELDILESILVPRKCAKGELILKEGEVCKEFLYIDKGLIRQFYIKKDEVRRSSLDQTFCHRGVAGASHHFNIVVFQEHATQSFDG